MSTTVREELRAYSKGDLTRITVLATKKQAAAEASYRRLRALVAVLMAGSFGAGVLVTVAVLSMWR